MEVGLRAENVSFVSCIARNCIIEVYNQQKRSSFEKEDVRWWVYEEHERTVLAMRIFFAGHVFCQTGSDDDHITQRRMSYKDSIPFLTGSRSVWEIHPPLILGILVARQHFLIESNEDLIK